MYDEKVDVYSFGLVLLCMAAAEPIVEFVTERFKRDRGLERRPQVPRSLVPWFPFP